MHILDCLDYYFTPAGSESYHWGHRFGGGWWELADDQLPGQAQVLAYAGELEARIEAELSALEDAALAEPYVQEEGPRQTRLGHYVYALRHTVHHHGQLSALGVFHGLEGGAWD